MVASYKDLKRQIADLEKKAAEVRKVEAVKIIEAIKAQIAEYELTPADLFDGVKAEAKPKTKTRTTASINPPKYMDPKSGKTWTGFGKAPAWIEGAIKKGKKDDFLISVVATARAEKEQVKAEAKSAAPARQVPVAKASAKAVKPAKRAAANQPTTKTKAPAASRRMPATTKSATPSAPAEAPAPDVVSAPAADEPAVQSGS
jgi:DNA-binding protein H-NS